MVERMVMLVFARNAETEMVSTLRDAGVSHYTLLSDLQGVGDAGPVLGSVVWPGENSLLLAGVSAEQERRIAEVVGELRERRHAHLPSTGIALFSLPCVQLV